jgi:DNA-binding NarL/FixJ family response regulator
MTIRVFLADDHPIIRDGLARVLEAGGEIKVVGSAENGRDAIHQVLQLKPDVAIFDISMPDMNGIEAARQLRERNSRIPILILSMHLTAEHVFHALEAGVHGYILKASVVQDVIQAVRTVHAGKRYLSPSVAEIVAEQIGKRSETSSLDLLSRREREILQLVAEGNSSAEVARLLSLSPKTVDTYRSRLMQKLQLRDITAIVKYALQNGLISLN